MVRRYLPPAATAAAALILPLTEASASVPASDSSVRHAEPRGVSSRRTAGGVVFFPSLGKANDRRLFRRRRGTDGLVGYRRLSSYGEHVSIDLPRGGGGGSRAAVNGKAHPAAASTPTKSAAKISVPSRPTTNGDASVPSEIFNLVKSIVGAGVLGLPAGIASFGSSPSALLPASVLICTVGLVSGYGFSLIGRVCAYTGARSYREAWDRSVGVSTSWMPALACTLVTTCSILAYSMILADTFRNLFAAAGYAVSRSAALLAITIPVLLPLCLLKNMSSLAPFSLVGICGMAYTSAAMAVRYVDGSYAAPDGRFLADLAEEHLPKFGNEGASAVWSPNVFILISMLCTAYMAHYNAPKFYIELLRNTLPRYNFVVGTSFAISVLIFAAVASLGFLTFGSSSSGLVLNNYSALDPIMSASRVAVALSIVFSYPLAFVGVRDGMLDLAEVPAEKRTDGTLNVLTFAILAGVTALALALRDLSFVLSFGGSTWGAALIYVFPAVMFRGAIRKMGDDEEGVGRLRREVGLATAKAVLGVVMGCIGTRMALKKL